MGFLFFKCDFTVASIVCLLPQAVFRQPFGDRIDDYQQHDIDERVEKADCCGIAVLIVDEAHFVYIGRNQLLGACRLRILHQISLFRTLRHDPSAIHDKQDNRGGNHAWQINMLLQRHRLLVRR